MTTSTLSAIPPGLGRFTVGQVMETFRIMLKGGFPEKDVGGESVFAPLPNGNTKVMYIFRGNSELSVEWEVSKACKLVRPLNEAAKGLMEGGGRQ